MEKKMTYVQAIDVALNAIPEGEAHERLVALKESLNKRNSRKSTSMTKTQKENMVIKENLLGIMAAGAEYTATDLTKAFNQAYDNEITIQRVSALLKQMVESGVVTKAMNGKRAMFAKVGE